MSYSMRRQGGLTLIELLVGVVLTALIVGMCIKIVISVRDVWLEQQERSLAARTGWRLVHHLSRDLRMTLLASTPGADGQWRGTDGGTTLYEALHKGFRPDAMTEELKATAIDDDSIQFPIARARDNEQLRPCVVQYTLKRAEEGHIAGVVRRVAPLGSPVSDAEDVLLGEQVISLNLKYLTADGAWVNKWSDSSATPRAVRISVGALPPRAQGGFNVMHFTTLVYLPAGSRISR